MAKTRRQLSDWALWVYDSKWIYAMGTYGQRLQTQYATLAKSYYYSVKNPSLFKKLTTRYKAGENPRLYDCHGIVDGFRMDNDTTAEIDFDPSVDTSANIEMNRVKSSGKLGIDYGSINASMKDNAGYGYWKDGHFGVGVGDGQVVDIWSTGDPARKRDQTLGNWTYWLKCYGIDYEEGDIMLQRGDKGLAVTYWQKSLLKWNSAALPTWGADSDFGGETETWTKQFQVAMGLPNTGVVDAITYGHMANVLISITAGIPQSELDAEKAKTAEALEQVTELTAGLASAQHLLDVSEDALANEQIKVSDLTQDVADLTEKNNQLLTDNVALSDTVTKFENAREVMRWYLGLAP